MNFDGAEKIAAAILYEGYILYPYRPTAIKNRQRWNFGTLYPRVYAQAQRPEEPFRLVAECLVVADDNGQPRREASFSSTRPRRSRAYRRSPTLPWHGMKRWNALQSTRISASANCSLPRSR